MHMPRNTETNTCLSRQAVNSTTIKSTNLYKKPASELIIFRGLPGSGKTTMAKVLTMLGYLHFEADKFFEFDGEYKYDASRIREAHHWCQRMTRDSLARGHKVVVSNTFTQIHEMKPYFEMTENIKVIEAQGKWNNLHDVPEKTLKSMAQRWEPFLDSIYSSQYQS